MVDVAVRTRSQGLEEQRLLLKEQLQIRKLEDRQRRQEEEKQRQLQEFATKPSLNNVIFPNEKTQRDEELRILYPVGLPEMPRKEAMQEELQNRPDKVFKEPQRAADLRGGLEQIKQLQARKKHGVELEEKEADNRIHQARQNPTENLNQNKLDKKLKKEEKEFKTKMENPKLSAKQKKKIFDELTGRAPSKNRLKLDPKAQEKRAKALLKKLSQEQRKRFEQQMKQANRSM